MRIFFLCLWVFSCTWKQNSSHFINLCFNLISWIYVYGDSLWREPNFQVHSYINGGINQFNEKCIISLNRWWVQCMPFLESTCPRKLLRQQRQPDKHQTASTALLFWKKLASVPSQGAASERNLEHTISAPPFCLRFLFFSLSLSLFLSLLFLFGILYRFPVRKFRITAQWAGWWLLRHDPSLWSHRAVRWDLILPPGGLLCFRHS